MKLKREYYSTYLVLGMVFSAMIWMVGSGIYLTAGVNNSSSADIVNRTLCEETKKEFYCSRVK
jgi:hypothetical protein